LAISHSLNTIGAALARLGRSAEAVEKIERSVVVAQEAGLLQAACRSYANLGVLYSTLDPSRAVETCQMGLDAAKKIGDLGFRTVCPPFRPRRRSSPPRAAWRVDQHKNGKTTSESRSTPACAQTASALMK
jgi:hypothetical protein